MAGAAGAGYVPQDLPGEEHRHATAGQFELGDPHRVDGDGPLAGSLQPVAPEGP